MVLCNNALPAALVEYLGSYRASRPLRSRILSLWSSRLFMSFTCFLVEWVQLFFDVHLPLHGITNHPTNDY
eukprot:m.88469 g.88469  ORF g.88469 m.88469 type:complete len:71 (-) comp14540_c2_seq1:309-521(-)